MPTYAICTKFVDDCGQDSRLIRDTLYYFVHSGPLRIAVDEEKRIIEEYAKIAEKYEMVGIWLNIIGKREPSDVFDHVPAPCQCNDGTGLCFGICSALALDRKLICSSVQDYAAHPVVENKITLIDRASAPDELRTAFGVGRNMVVINADHSHVTTGNDSGISIGAIDDGTN